MTGWFRGFLNKSNENIKNGLFNFIMEEIWIHLLISPAVFCTLILKKYFCIFLELWFLEKYFSRNHKNILYKKR
jgi:hypothetical protein